MNNKTRDTTQNTPMNLFFFLVVVVKEKHKTAQHEKNNTHAITHREREIERDEMPKRNNEKNI
jgi:hypothetical protein